MAFFQADYFPAFSPPPHSYIHPPPPLPPAPHAASPPPSRVFPPPPPHVFPPPPPHVFPPPPPPSPHVPPPSPTPAHHATVIIVVFVSLGGLFFLAFLSLALCCFIKKRKKVEKSEIIKVEEHFKIQEAVVPGRHGEETVVLSMEEDIKIEEKIKKDEKLGETDEGAVIMHEGPSHSHSHGLLHVENKTC